MKIVQDNIRILGKGVTAFALKDKFPNATLYDDSDFEKYDLTSNELTVVSPGIPPYNKIEMNSYSNYCGNYNIKEDPET